MDLKTILPLLYHLQHQRNSEDLPFWLQLAREQGGPVLELGCGTGRVLTQLLQAGHRAYGLDRNLEMLEFFCSLYQRRSAITAIFQADMTQFHLALKFPLIILPCNTFSTLTLEQRQATLRCVSWHLAENGLFAAAVPNPSLLLDLPLEAETEEEDYFFLPDGDPVQVSSAWQRNRELFRLSWIYDRLLPDGHVQRLKVDTEHFLTSLDEHLSYLVEAGLTTTALYGDFDYSAYTEYSSALILIARKTVS
jgi:SAM-dependent methyltransferase